MFGTLILLLSSALAVPFPSPNSQNPCIFLAFMNFTVLLIEDEHRPLFFEVFTVHFLLQKQTNK